MKFKLIGGVVECINRNSIPEENTTIVDDLDLNVEQLINELSDINYYFRAPEDCPFLRGNWCIDLNYKNGQTLCVKLPKEMEEKAVKYFIEPLINRMSN